MQYLYWIAVWDAPLLALLLLSNRTQRQSPIRLSLRQAVLAGIGSEFNLLAYGFVLYAYTIAQVSVVVALRENSVIFGVLIGVFFLNEAKSRARVTGSLIIATGAAIIVTNLPG